MSGHGTRFIYYKSRTRNQLLMKVRGRKGTFKVSVLLCYPNYISKWLERGNQAGEVKYIHFLIHLPDRMSLQKLYK